MGMNNKQEILKLRLEGYGYKRIATMLDLPLNTVKSCCRRNQYSKDSAEQTSVCLCCKTPIEQMPHRKRKKFCSRKCSNAWWNKHKEKHTGETSIICGCCHKIFESYKSKNQKYCSRKCYDQMRGVACDE